MQRILRRRSDPHEQADEQPTHAFEQPTTRLPAGLPEEETAPPPSARSFRERGRLRRRLRYLRRARELGFRDLGGLIFDLRRFGRDRPDLVQTKLDALTRVDRELRVLEIALDQRRPIHELREPGIASCPHCGALHATDARFCSTCGVGLRGSRAVGDAGDGGAQHSVGELGALQVDGREEHSAERWPDSSW
ncbi:MAG TPA: zinc ribbon domain-containing protein [Solirubrobacteraceae bacterium]|nr:zinc ribbon domain-containing protein [Solirubrobacteraceae bacterium]